MGATLTAPDTFALNIARFKANNPQLFERAAREEAERKAAAAKLPAWYRNAPGDLDEYFNDRFGFGQVPPTLAAALEEGAYVLGLFEEGGTFWTECLEGRGGPKARLDALAFRRKLKAWIKKYTPTT